MCSILLLGMIVSGANVHIFWKKAYTL